MSAPRPESSALIAARLEVAASKKRLLDWAQVEDAQQIDQDRSALKNWVHQSLSVALEIGLQQLGSHDRVRERRWVWLALAGWRVLRAIRRR